MISMLPDFCHNLMATEGNTQTETSRNSRQEEVPQTRIPQTESHRLSGGGGSSTVPATGEPSSTDYYQYNDQDEASKESIKPPARCMLVNDRFSELPPEILIEILSKLKMKEAGKTSIISKSWRYMWTKVRNLDFEDPEVLHDLLRETKFIRAEQPIYVRFVNDVIRLHQGETIDQFAIVFNLDHSSHSHIDRWVSFAIRKKVQKLRLDLWKDWGSEGYTYTFPLSLEISRCSSLTSLHLTGVNITGEALQLFLCNSLNLESLSVLNSKTLQSLTVDGPSLKLRWLELCHCHNINHLNVSAPDLISFRYSGPKIPMPLKDVPKLLEITFESDFGCHLTNHLDLSELSSYLSRLEKLTLEACEVKENIDGANFPSLPKLKHLTLTITTHEVNDLLVYATMINASPSLHKFSIQVQGVFLTEALSLENNSLGCLAIVTNTTDPMERPQPPYPMSTKRLLIQGRKVGRWSAPDTMNYANRISHCITYPRTRSGCFGEQSNCALNSPPFAKIINDCGFDKMHIFPTVCGGSHDPVHEPIYPTSHFQMHRNPAGMEETMVDNRPSIYIGRRRCLISKTPHSIKEVEFLGFRGNVVEVELGTHLIENALMLEKLTFDPLSPLRRDAGYGLSGHLRVSQDIARRASFALGRAKEIGKRLPPEAQLIIIMD